MQGRGKFAITEQANIAQQGALPMNKLVENSMDLNQEHRPVISPLMQTQQILTQPTPELFNRIEPMSVALSPDGERVLTGSQDGTVRLWDTETSQLLRVQRTRSRRVERGVQSR